MSKVFSIDLKIVRPEEATVSVMDRSFLYGDSVYEVVRTYRGKTPFLVDRHFARLKRSASAVRLKIPFSLEQLSNHIRECVERADHGDSYVRIVVSRGADDRFDLAPQEKTVVRTVILVDRVHTYPESHFTEGVPVALVSVRRNLRTAVDPNVKSGNYMNNMLALMEARDRGAHDAVMLNYKDCVTEATTSNVFVVSNGVVMTPDVESGILEGISRALLLEILEREKIRHEEREIPRDLFLASDEMFLTGTTKEIMPICTVDGNRVGSGKPGPVTRRLQELYKAEVGRIIEAS